MLISSATVIQKMALRFSPHSRTLTTKTTTISKQSYVFFSNLGDVPGSLHVSVTLFDKGLSNHGNKVHRLRLEYASEGLVSIHDHGYVHCDIKPDNLLLFPSSISSYELKISDFGKTLEVGEVPKFWESEFPCYWRWEGLVLEMYTGVIPWEGVNLDLLATRLRRGKAPEIPESLPSVAKAFIETISQGILRREEALINCCLIRSCLVHKLKKKTSNSFLLKLF
ncbi:hypothetical protein F2Q68_00038674 [Brassica cretica]|uniref:Protein kinase domain-containing protein n=1 Tax=Brassica cretica TaxID=69181 RepID=A0A8S9MKG9_BRACR|nr:hypothetical protein F2Q68_00038674 [Brassica cretica]